MFNSADSRSLPSISNTLHFPPKRGINLLFRIGHRTLPAFRDDRGVIEVTRNMEIMSSLRMFKFKVESTWALTISMRILSTYIGLPTRESRYIPTLNGRIQTRSGSRDCQKPTGHSSQLARYAMTTDVFDQNTIKLATERVYLFQARHPTGTWIYTYFLLCN